MTKKEFFSIRDLLVTSNEEDYNVGIENIKNIKPGKVKLSLFAKSLRGYQRKRFEDFVAQTFGFELEITEWNTMFETIKNECDETDKEIVEDIINKDLSMLKEHYSFIKNFKIKLKW